MAKVNVMIVEDDAITAMDIESQLKQLGYGVSAKASYGKDAIQKAKENTPDLVLMDIILKGEMDGIEAAEEIHTQFDIPVIFLTAFANKDRLERAKLTYPFGFILKPFQDKDLKVTIEMALYVAKVDAERKQTEEKYRSLLDDVVDSSNIGIFILDSDFKVVWVNRALERYFGLRREEIVGKDKRELILKQIKYKFENPEGFAEKVLATYDDNTYVESFESHILAYEKCEERWLEHWSRPIHSGFYSGGRVELYYDITERKQAEERLLEELTTKEILLDNLPCVALILKKQTREIVASNKAAKQIGAVPGKTCYETCAQRDDNCPFCLAPELWATGDPQRLEVEYRGTYYEGIWVPLTDELYVHYIFDITDRKKAEEALRESEERYKSLFKNNHSVMLLIDPENADIVDANPAAISYYGWSYEELTSKKITNINTLTEEQVFHEIEQANNEQRNHFFFRHRLSNGDIRGVEVYSGPIKVHGKNLLYSIIHDITDRKQAK